MKTTSIAVTTTEACRQIGVTRRTLGKFLVASKFPNAFSLGDGNPGKFDGSNQWRIPQSDIDAFKALRRITKHTTRKSTRRTAAAT